MIDYPAPDLKLLSGTIAIGTATLAYLFYLFLFSSDSFTNRLFDKHSYEVASIRKVLYQRLYGAVLYGLVPVGIVLLLFKRPLNNYGFSGEYMMKSFLWWIPIAVVVIIVSYFGAKQKNNLAMYPQIRVSQWSRGLLSLSALSWTAYLVGYEFMFRGFILFSCLENFGYWPAIIINICLYSLFHIHKGSREAIGSLFFGFLLCYLTLHLGSFWFAIFIHVTMALSNEWFSLGFQPEMKLVKNGNKG